MALREPEPSDRAERSEVKVRNKVLIFLFLLSMITYIDRVCISVAGPRMQADLGMTPTSFGWLVGAFAISYAAFEVPGGMLGDKYGPRSVLTIVIWWWSVFTTLTGMVSNYVLLLITRFFFGAGEAAAYPVASTAVSRWFPTTERARATGLVWMASRVGGAVSPLLIVPLQMRYGWRVSFYLFGILGVIWGVAWYWWFRDYPSEKAGVSKQELDEIGAPTRAERHSLPWGIAIRKGNLWALMFMYFTYCYASFFFLSWLQTYLVKGRGFREKDLLLSTLPFVLGALANLAGGITSDYMVKKVGLKWGRRSCAIVGLGLAAVFTVATLLTEAKIPALIFLALSYAGSDFMLPSAWATCMDIGKKYAGAVTGAMNTAGQVGSFLSSVLFGYLVTMSGSYDVPLIPMAVMLVISAVMWLKINPTEQLVE